LDTQEFYEGILKAIPAQLWDLYIQSNYPPDLLFNLFVQKIVMHLSDGTCSDSNHTTACEFVFQNYVGFDAQVDLFQAFGDYLMWLGMTTELQKPKTVPFDRPQNINVRYVGAPGTDKNSAEVVAPPGGSSTSDAGASKNYGLCFAPRLNSSLVGEDSRCGHIAKPGDKTSVDSRIGATGAAKVSLKITPELIGLLKRIAHTVASNPDPDPLFNMEQEKELELALNHFDSFDESKPTPVSITVYLRHTEGVIYYLGELARRSLSDDYGEGTRDIFVKRAVGYGEYPINEPCEHPSFQCAYIFRLQKGSESLPGDFLSVNYNGAWYSISGTYDRDKPDLSSLSLDFVKQLIAINSSAKSLPQSSVLSVVGAQ
jgi:hypothetical protein